MNIEKSYILFYFNYANIVLLLSRMLYIINIFSDVCFISIFKLKVYKLYHFF